jgi:predicted peptidase
MKYLSFLFAFVVLYSCKPKSDDKNSSNSKAFEKGFTKASFYDSKGDVLLYNILEPVAQEGIETYPLFIFLHGAGERGDDNEKQLVHIAPIFEHDSIQKRYPSYVVFPQCPENDKWGAVDVIDGEWIANAKKEPTKPMKGVMALVENLIDQYPVDTNRIYISGLSMGGYGTYDILSRIPDRFAAAISICGGGDIDMVSRYAHVPMKIFHGSKDLVVPPDFSRKMYKAIQLIGAANLEYIEYPEGTHNVWDQAYSEPGILDWVYSQKK